MRKVEGTQYLYQRAGSYLVRVQVPSALQPKIGKRELKKALSGSLRDAKRAASSIGLP
jgi:hypothetical protein